MCEPSQARPQEDLYRLPPTDIKAFDEWKEEQDESDLADIPIPEPDYTQEDDTASQQTVIRSHSTPETTSSKEGLIEPKKLRNPCLESKERQELHREMIMNQKMGVDVLHQKSELARKMDDLRDHQKKKEQLERERSRRTSLDKKLEEQASKLKFTEDKESVINNRPTPIPEDQCEFLKMHSKISRSKSDR